MAFVGNVSARASMPIAYVSPGRPQGGASSGRRGPRNVPCEPQSRSSSPAAALKGCRRMGIPRAAWVEAAA
eukprot:3769272-Pleurochrysis_carterae.AAC.1